jgi:lysophospholipase L1-like esterase
VRLLQGLAVFMGLWALAACGDDASSSAGDGGTGGTQSGGSSSVSGGGPTGGATASGTGGTGVGGTLATGGRGNAGASVIPQGGSSSGGVSTGGRATGGVLTGGVSTGGAATGGVSTGGVSTGGAATGGVSTGGVSTGGATSGGRSFGGSGGRSAGGAGTGGSSAGGASSGGTTSSGGGSATGGSSTTGGATTGGATGFDPCPASDPCKIMPLGDSITDGTGYSGGYRVELFAKAIADEKNITFVGSLSNGPDTVSGVTFPKSHEGHFGWTISQVDELIPDPALGPAPHIVLVHLGTNDVNQNQVSGASDRLGSLIDQIIAELPDTLIVVAKIIPEPSKASGIDTLNAAIPGVVQARAGSGKHVILVDQFTGFPSSELGDGVHPNQAGYERMAGVWYEAIKSYLH